MRSMFLSGFAFAAFLSLAAPAWGDDVSDRTAAIQLCKAEVAAQAGVAAEDVQLDSVRTRARAVRVDLDLWRNGQLQNIRCDVTRGETLTVASIDPPLSATQALAR